MKLKPLHCIFAACSEVENQLPSTLCPLPSPSWFQTTPPYGEYPGGASITDANGKPIEGAVIVFDEASTDKIIEAFQAAAKTAAWPGVLVDQEHFSLDYDKPSTALAWAKEIRRAEDGSLWTRWEFTEKGRALYEGKMLINRSPVLRLEKAIGQRSKVKGQEEGQRSKVKGQTEESNHHRLTSDLSPLTFYPVELESIGMTNTPHFKTLSPLAAAKESNNPEGAIQMDPEILAALGLAPEAGKEEVLAAISQLKDKEAAASAKASETAQEAENEKKRADEAEATCRGMKADAFIAKNADRIGDTAAFREAYLANPELVEKTLATCKVADKPTAPVTRIVAKDAKTPTGENVLTALAACKSAEERCAFAVKHAKELAALSK